MYSETAGGLSFDEMRLVEETLVQADAKLKAAVNGALGTFVEVVKTSSKVKGARWDDIVAKFEYQAVIVKELLSQLEGSKLS